ncbi:MAG TPA: isoprenylcysteine carboxylmethyltransferase family protein [Candidatus Acidoferrales bacterium]|nr:isoprenylcysteine carboxylmethyltransferase family protein [Candidatus Acidoferrales bacterium]
MTVVVVAAWIGVEAYAARGGARQRDAVQDGGTKRFLVLTLYTGLAAAIVIALYFPTTRLPAPEAAWFWSGVSVALTGAGLRAWAIRTLGEFFTRDVMIREAHFVVSRGPYRLLRHPSYTGTGLIMLGFGLMLGSWLSAVVVVTAFAISHLPRILHEECVLSARFGSEYEEFTRKRRRLVPFLW